MNNVIEQMLLKYDIKNTNDEINVLKEVIQEIVLSGLSRGGFFKEAAFYGGTALRIFYKFDRFSEDLDYALINTINDEYHNLTMFSTDDLVENIFWKEYYLTLQMYFLSKRIADDKGIDLTMPEYNPQLIKKLYNFKGEM
mgnify:CR=1 FL=1